MIKGVESSRIRRQIGAQQSGGGLIAVCAIEVLITGTHELGCYSSRASQLPLKKFVDLFLRTINIRLGKLKVFQMESLNGIKGRVPGSAHSHAGVSMFG